jgi:hypothetical protein
LLRCVIALAILHVHAGTHGSGKIELNATIAAIA